METQEYERLKQQAKLEYHQRLAAIESVWEMAQKMGLTNGIPSTPSGHTNRVYRRRANAGRGQLLKAVRKAIKAIEEPFTFESVVNEIQKQSPTITIKRSSLKGTLKKLAEAKALEIVVQGKGRRPTEYKRAN